MTGKKLEKHNLAIAFNVLYANIEKIHHVYVSKHNSNFEKQVFLLMISNGEGWHYIAGKKLSALLRGISSKYDGAFYCLSYFYWFRAKIKLKKVWKIKFFCIVAMPSEDTKILEFNQYQKSGKTPFIIFANLESLKKSLMNANRILKNHLQQK